jgi:hypothetical protein
MKPRIDDGAEQLDPKEPAESVNFRLHDKRLVDLAKRWSGILKVSPAELLEAVLLDWLADAIVWKYAFPQVEFPCPMIRRDVETDRLFLGGELFKSLLESKLTTMENTGVNADRLRQSLKDQLTVEGFLESCGEDKKKDET